MRYIILLLLVSCGMNQPQVEDCYKLSLEMTSFPGICVVDYPNASTYQVQPPVDHMFVASENGSDVNQLVGQNYEIWDGNGPHGLALIIQGVSQADMDAECVFIPCSIERDPGQ